MKILGVNPKGYSDEAEAYIVEISVDEVRKVANKAGYRQDDTLGKLKVGNEHPIAEGHDFRREIVEATRQMQAAYASFQKAAETMTRFAALIAQQDDSADQAGEG